MAWSLVQHTAVGGTSGGTGNSPTVDSTGATFSGLVVGGNSIATPTDFFGNSYSFAVLANDVSNAGVAIYYCDNPTVGAGHWFNSATAFGSLCALLFSGGNGPVDQTNSGFTSSSGNVHSNQITPLVSGELVITGLSGGDNATCTVADENANLSYSITDRIGLAGGAHWACAAAWASDSGTLATNVRWTSTVTNVLESAIASFKAAGAASRLRFNANLDGLSASGGFFANRLAA